MPGLSRHFILIIYSYIMRCCAAPEYLAQLPYKTRKTSKNKENEYKLIDFNH